MNSSNTFFWLQAALLLSSNRYCSASLLPREKVPEGRMRFAACGAKAPSHSSTFCSFFSKVCTSKIFANQLKKHRTEIYLRLSGGVSRTNARSGRVVLDFFVSFFVKKKRKRKKPIINFFPNIHNFLITIKFYEHKNLHKYHKHLYQIVLLLIFFIVSINASAQQKSLDYFINQGIQNSPLLKENNNNILLNRIDSLRIVASYKPQVSGISNNYYAPVVKGYGYDEIITNFRNFSEQVSASKTFVSRRILHIQFNGIQLLNDSLLIAGKITAQDLRRTIIAAYIAAYGSWRQYTFNQQVYNLLSKEDTILKKLTQASVYRQTDYLTFLVTLQQQHLAITEAKIQYQNDFATLNYVSGLFDTTLTPLDSPRIALAQLPEINASIFYQKFSTDSLLLQNAGEQIDLYYKPRVSVTADGGYVSSLSYTPYKNFGASAAVNVIVPIYDGKQRKLLHRRLDILEGTRQNYRDFFATQYSQQIAQLSQQLQLSRQLIDETNNQLKYVNALIEANARLLATGDVRIADYIIAINNYLNAQNVITQNIVSELQIITQINYWNKP